MLYGIIGLFVMVSVWGLVTIVKNTFDLDDNSNNLYFSNYNFWKGGSDGGGGNGKGGGTIKINDDDRWTKDSGDNIGDFEGTIIPPFGDFPT